MGLLPYIAVILIAAILVGGLLTPIANQTTGQLSSIGAINGAVILSLPPTTDINVAIPDSFQPILWGDCVAISTSGTLGKLQTYVDQRSGPITGGTVSVNIYTTTGTPGTTCTTGASVVALFASSDSIDAAGLAVAPEFPLTTFLFTGSNSKVISAGNYIIAFAVNQNTGSGRLLIAGRLNPTGTLLTEQSTPGTVTLPFTNEYSCATAGDCMGFTLYNPDLTPSRSANVNIITSPGVSVLLPLIPGIFIVIFLVMAVAAYLKEPQGLGRKKRPLETRPIKPVHAEHRKPQPHSRTNH